MEPSSFKSGLTAEAAVERSYEDMWNRLSGTNDQYLKERLHDLRDVADRMQSYLSGDFKDIGEIRNWSDIVVVAQTMGPADLMDYDYHKIRGLIIEDGTPTMHVAIVAKALNIPVIAKIKGLFEEVKTGELIAVDGNDSYVYINPQPAVQEKFKAKIAEKESKAKLLQSDLDKKITETQPIIDGFDGLMARINALDKLPWAPSFFIMLLFLAIETSPIIAKLLSPKGEYDFKLEDLETALKATLDQDKYQRALLVKTSATMHDKVYEDITEDKNLYDLQRKKATELLELQAHNFVEKQKRTL